MGSDFFRRLILITDINELQAVRHVMKQQIYEFTQRDMSKQTCCASEAHRGCQVCTLSSHLHQQTRRRVTRLAAAGEAVRTEWAET